MLICFFFFSFITSPYNRRRPVCLCMCFEQDPLGRLVVSHTTRLNHHQSFSFTSIHATAILHQSPGWAAPPTAPFRTALLLVVFLLCFFFLLTVRVPHSIPHPLRTYRLSVNAYQMKAGRPSLPAPGRGRAQSERTSRGSSGGKMGICLISEIATR